MVPQKCFVSLLCPSLALRTALKVRKGPPPGCHWGKKPFSGHVNLS